MIYLIYNSNEVEINQFSIQKYIDCFNRYGIKCILLTTDNYKQFLGVPQAVINRTNNYIISKYFEEMGVRVFNSMLVTKICNNKEETYKFLGDEIKHLKLLNKEEITFPIVVKLPTSKGGKDVYLIENQEEFDSVYNKDMILQEYLPDAVDIRTYIIGNEIVLSLKRSSESGFKANYKINHKAEVYKLNNIEKKMIDNILQKFQFDYVGIDILKNEKTGEFYFSEIEDSVGARAVYDITDIDIIAKYVDYIMNQLKLN